jgi:hypothetical protein
MPNAFLSFANSVGSARIMSVNDLDAGIATTSTSGSGKNSPLA